MSKQAQSDADSAPAAGESSAVAVDEAKLRSRHWLRVAVRETFRRYGARFGVIWVIVMAALAVLAPCLANSYPILASRDGELSSPLVQHLTPVDVILLGVGLCLIVLWCLRRLSFPRRLAIFVVAVAILSIGSFIFVSPSQRKVYEEYRQLVAAKEVDWVLWAPIRYSPSDRSRDVEDAVYPQGPSRHHWLGTDRYGADIASKMIHATRIALAVGFIAESIALVIGAVIGGLMGYFAGWVDLLGLRLVEIFSSIPRLYLLLAFVAFFGRNIYLIMIIIGATAWTGYAYFTRAEFLRLRKQDFVQAAKACGLPLHSILFKHMLPNGMAPLLVSAGFGVASAILYEAVLSFLGLGVVDQPSWGEMLNQVVAEGGGFYWYLATFPGMAIFLSVFAFNLIGEAFRDELDPHTSRASMG